MEEKVGDYEDYEDYEDDGFGGYGDGRQLVHGYDGYDGDGYDGDGYEDGGHEVQLVHGEHEDYSVEQTVIVIADEYEYEYVDGMSVGPFDDVIKPTTNQRIIFHNNAHVTSSRSNLGFAEFIYKNVENNLVCLETHCNGSGVYGYANIETVDRSTLEPGPITSLRLNNPVILDLPIKASLYNIFGRGIIQIAKNCVANPELTINPDLIQATFSENPEIFGEEVFYDTERWGTRQLPETMELGTDMHGDICTTITLETIFATIFPEIVEIIEVGIYDYLVEKLNNFLTDWRKAEIGDFLFQPTNYILMPFYDGIYYGENVGGNDRHIGCVKYYYDPPMPRKFEVQFDESRFDDSRFLTNGNCLHHIIDEGTEWRSEESKNEPDLFYKFLDQHLIKSEDMLLEGTVVENRPFPIQVYDEESFPIQEDDEEDFSRGIKKSKSKRRSKRKNKSKRRRYKQLS